jgi:hypothetical protein
MEAICDGAVQCDARDNQPTIFACSIVFGASALAILLFTGVGRAAALALGVGRVRVRVEVLIQARHPPSPRPVPVNAVANPRLLGQELECTSEMQRTQSERPEAQDVDRWIHEAARLNGQCDPIRGVEAVGTYVVPACAEYWCHGEVLCFLCCLGVLGAVAWPALVLIVPGGLLMLGVAALDEDCCVMFGAFFLLAWVATYPFTVFPMLCPDSHITGLEYETRALVNSSGSMRWKDVTREYSRAEESLACLITRYFIYVMIAMLWCGSQIVRKS